MRLTIDAKLTPAEVAEAFWDLNDEEQADVFIALGERSKRDDPAGMQPWYVGRHLRSCACATEEAREFVREIARAIDAEQQS